MGHLQASRPKLAIYAIWSLSTFLKWDGLCYKDFHLLYDQQIFITALELAKSKIDDLTSYMMHYQLIWLHMNINLNCL